jgi:hypothetical protein
MSLKARQYLREIEKNVPETLAVHLIVDNYATQSGMPEPPAIPCGPSAWVLARIA